ncbi:E3 SUMO-protein ligase ZBED1-like [Hypomesus transpacificus]|uniref:E3 SUMO-protein ligase ZBED1-like n=1 Tax=Hypomesus transpacificus TaxID=137520 RepID=UPI001F07CFFC|nr:E3 SUMO-protein ligase ZBED1-like [Hypomesus transpacificus]
MEHAESLSLRKGTQIKSKPVVVRPKQSTMSAFVPYEQTSKRHKDITNAITYCIAKDMQPISTVEKQGFKKLIKILDPRYVLPGRKYFSHTALPKMYAECREKVEEALQRDLTYFASTTDLWSSRTSEPYISLTIHYIDKEWNLQNKCLQTSYFPDDHTGEAIAEGLKDAFASWGLSEDKQVCITSDSGANVVKAAQINKWTRLPCFGHRLHLAIERVARDKRVDRATGVCKKVVGAFSYSWKKKRDLAIAQKERNLPQHKLVTETPTRWGSRQKMVQRVLEQEKAISQAIPVTRRPDI